ncbi:MAG: aldehyde dehydrogenase family protein [Rubripirellula sp.]
MNQYSNNDQWESLSTKARCQRIAKVAAHLVDCQDALLDSCTSKQRSSRLQTIGAEVLPLCSALRFIGKQGARILRPTRYGLMGRPAWLWGVHSTVRRDPRGTVLILGTWNYPLFLTGVQTAQALAAGNRVIIKPAAGSEPTTKLMVEAFYKAGVPESHLRRLDSSTQAAIDAMDAGVDLIVLTGAAATGRAVLKQAAKSLTPAIMELSGCDATILMPDCDLDLAVRSIVFALTMNGGATCIGPRRLVVEDRVADDLLNRLCEALQDHPPLTVHEVARNGAADVICQAIQQGASESMGHFEESRLRETGWIKPLVLDQVKPNDSIASADIFAPVVSLIRVSDINEAVEMVNQCPYRLAASVFGPTTAATKLAKLLQVGSVAINDLVVPTADPRLPFGGRGDSGFGVTRGREGLLQMTTPKVISQRRGKFAAHLAFQSESDAQTLIGALQLLHAGSFSKRISGLKKMVSSTSKRNSDNVKP